MPREKGSSQGSVYFRPDRKRWIAQYYDYDPITLKSSKKTKCFKDEDSAKKYIKSLMYQKENPIYIENHGIPLKELMSTIVQNKFDNNLISEAQYNRVNNTLKNIFKGEIVNKNI